MRELLLPILIHRIQNIFPMYLCDPCWQSRDIFLTVLWLASSLGPTSTILYFFPSSFSSFQRLQDQPARARKAVHVLRASVRPCRADRASD